MTRKTIAIAFIVLAGIVLPASSARPIWAQPLEETRPLRLYVDIGYVNLFDYPKWIALGPEFELRLHRLVSVNPDIAVWIGESPRGTARVVPGATVNLRLRRFFVGVGAVGRISEWGESASGWLVPKAQVGYLSGPAKLVLSLLYLNQTNEVVVGMTIGIGIGRRQRD